MDALLKPNAIRSSLVDSKTVVVGISL